MKGSRKSARGAVDWAEIRRRLADADALPSPSAKAERARAILAERARVLARPPPAERRDGASIEIITFALANERYAIEARYVREVVRVVDLTPVPGTPEFIAGIVNLRGEILAVVDLRRFFGVALRGLTDLSRLIVLGLARAELGVLADAAHDLTRLSVDEILEPSATVTGINREYLRGVTREALLVLDGGALLRDGRLFIDDAEPEAAGRKGAQ